MKEASGASKDLVRIIETKNIPMKGFTFIEGFPDLGLAGTIGARYLVEKLKFEQVGFIDSRVFMPMIRIQQGTPMHPVRIYASKTYKIVIVIAEQIMDNAVAPFMAEELVAWIKKKGIKRVISTSGVRIPDGKPIYAFASNEESKKVIHKNKIQMIDNGITSGVTALLMLGLKDNDIEAFCLLGNAKNNADYNAAAEVVKVICALTNITIDIKPLLAEAKNLEEAIVQHLKNVEETKEIKPDATPMYT
ncbi:MAG: PAC2 family protein [Candidatus Diapherotrites archaeon]|nr:PAC2 family protein [Candidatus Diapherotrites archaeon]